LHDGMEQKSSVCQEQTRSTHSAIMIFVILMAHSHRAVVLASFADEFARSPIGRLRQ
jgi:hypothetical protein